jgi:hypothetical protein
MANSARPHFNDKTKGYKTGYVDQYTPEQHELLARGIENVGPDSTTARMAAGDESMFNQIEAPALKQFSELQGGMASRFSRGAGQGALGNRNSSGFRNSMNQAGMDFAGDLQSKRQGLMRQATMDLHDMSQQLLSNRPYERTMTQKEKPWWQEASRGFANSFAQSAGEFAGNPSNYMPAPGAGG